MKKRNQKLTKEQSIIAAMDAVSKQIRVLEKYVAKFNKYIDEEAIAGNDAGARQLIKSKIGVNNFIGYLETIKRGLERGALTTQALSGLGSLPNAIKGCRGYLAELPDLSKLGDSVADIFNDINEAESALAELADVFNPASADSIESRLYDTAEDETSDQFKAEYKAMEDRVKAKIAAETVSKPQGTTVSATGDVDIMGILEEEKNRK